jgi:MerR family transcriptional regulator/heat shock protein HspR
MDRQIQTDEPMFVISVAARLVEMHPQTLRYYERAGLVKPTRSRGRIRLYSHRDIERLRKIARLVEDLGVNLAGVEVILNLTEKLESLQRLLEYYNIPLGAELKALEPHNPVRSTERTAMTDHEAEDGKTSRTNRARRARTARR